MGKVDRMTGIRSANLEQTSGSKDISMRMECETPPKRCQTLKFKYRWTFVDWSRGNDPREGEKARFAWEYSDSALLMLLLLVFGKNKPFSSKLESGVLLS